MIILDKLKVVILLKNKSLIFGLIFATLLFISLGYAALNGNFVINGTASITSTWNIKITGIRAINDKTVSNNTASDKSQPNINTDNLSVEFYTSLLKPLDTRIYEVEVSNLGTIDATVTSSYQNNSMNDSIIITYDGVSNTSILSNDGTYTNTSNDRNTTFSLPATTNNKKYIYIIVKYADVDTQPDNLEAYITLSLNAYQSTMSNSSGVNEELTYYSINYDLDGGTLVNPPTIYNESSSDITLPEPTKDGYVFTGWTSGKNLFNIELLYVPVPSGILNLIEDIPVNSSSMLKFPVVCLYFEPLATVTSNVIGSSSTHAYNL